MLEIDDNLLYTTFVFVIFIGFLTANYIHKNKIHFPFL